ncbi:MAG TPA: hypothetical protein VMA13_06755 [Candidatus Saccharimonadales bacterium]|nr:hypothetical protein [Candidatus Saccharimonadales bacterium]
MNEPEINPSVPSELTDQIAALRRQASSLLLALIVVSGTLAVYLWYQSRVTGQTIDALKPEAIQITKAYDQNRPGMDKFIKQLVVYAQSHPDFQPILKKYGISLTPTAANSSEPK